MCCHSFPKVMWLQHIMCLVCIKKVSSVAENGLSKKAECLHLLPIITGWCIFESLGPRLEVHVRRGVPTTVWLLPTVILPEKSRPRPLLSHTNLDRWSSPGLGYFLRTTSQTEGYNCKGCMLDVPAVWTFTLIIIILFIRDDGKKRKNQSRGATTLRSKT